MKRIKQKQQQKYKAKHKTGHNNKNKAKHTIKTKLFISNLPTCQLQAYT